MSEPVDANRPRSLLERLRPAPPAAAPRAVEALVPTPAPGALEPAPAPKPKVKPLSFQRLAKLVSRETGGFETVILMAVSVVKNEEAEPRDRIKAAEFLAKWTEANPSTVRHTISGPDGKPVAVAHAHAHVIKHVMPDMSNLSDAELDAYEKLASKAAGANRQLPAPAPADIVDAEVEPA